MPNKEKLSQGEVTRLVELEDTIKNAETNREQALLEIHDSKLYREYGTFEDYCLMRWSIGKSRAHQLLDHARANSTIVDLANEAQSRELKRLSPDQAKKVVLKAAESGPLTAKKLRAARAETIKVEPPRQRRATPEEKDRRAEEVARLWQEGYTRSDIGAALGVSNGTIAMDLASKGVSTGRRPPAGLKPSGHPIEIHEWRDQPEQVDANVIRLTLVPGKAACDLDRESADRMINNADAGTDHLAQYIDNGYELTESQIERLTMIRDRVDRLIREAAEQKGVG
jgi:hypothetical protein